MSIRQGKGTGRDCKSPPCNLSLPRGKCGHEWSEGQCKDGAKIVVWPQKHGTGVQKEWVKLYNVQT